MPIDLFQCTQIRSRLSPTQCAHLWRFANGPAVVTGRGEHVRVARRECVGCDIGAAHARGEVAPGVELFPAEALLRAPTVPPPVSPSAPSMEDEMTAKFTDEQKADAVRRVSAGERAQAVAEEIGCSQTAIYQWGRKAEQPAKAKPPRKKPVREVAKEKAAQRASRTGRARPKPAVRAPKAIDAFRHPDAVSLDDTIDTPKPRPYTVAAPSRVAHEDVIAFLARLPPMPWTLGDAIRLLAFHAIDGDFDDVTQARERIYAYLLARGEAA